MFSCLQNMVGVTDTDCECLIDGVDDDVLAALRLSTTGMYMDNIPDAIPWKALKTTDACKDFAELGLDARNQALEDFCNDVTVAISNLYKKAVSQFCGALSKMAYNQTLTDATRFQGMQIIGHEHTDAIMLITNMKLVGNIDGELTVTIKRTILGENDFTVIGTYPVMLSANNYAVVTLPAGGVSLPLGINLQPYDYRIYYDIGNLPDFRAKNTEFGCGCQGSDKHLIETYVRGKGISFLSDADNDSMNTFTSDNFTRGLILNVEIGCKTETFVCREFKTEEDIQIASKYAVAYRANEILNEKVLSSPEINQYTMQSREYLWGKRTHFAKEYQTRLQFIAERVNINNSDCFKCGNRVMFKGKIKS